MGGAELLLISNVAQRLNDLGWSKKYFLPVFTLPWLVYQIYSMQAATNRFAIEFSSVEWLVVYVLYSAIMFVVITYGCFYAIAQRFTTDTKLLLLTAIIIVAWMDEAFFRGGSSLQLDAETLDPLFVRAFFVVSQLATLFLILMPAPKGKRKRLITWRSS